MPTMTLQIDRATEARVAESLVPYLIEPAWENPNRPEARRVAEATARKLAAAAAATLVRERVRQVAPATFAI